jgi:hypothetical protein
MKGWSYNRKFMKKITGKISLAVALLLAMGTLAQADSISFTNSIASTSSPWGPDSLSIPQFDTSGGSFDLTNISFSLFGSMLADMQATNSDPASRVIRLYTMDGEITAYLAGDPLVIAYPQAVAVSGHPTYSLPSHTSHAWTGVSGNDTETASYDSSWGSFNNFIGPGTVVGLTMDSISYVTFSADSGVDSSSQAYSGAQLIVTYDFTVVPEPSSALFLGFGGLALIWCRRFTR